MTLSIEESIEKLKAEIIAQDWRLSPKRAGQLEAAFSCLQQRFNNRKATHAMLVMAGSTLDYIKKKGGSPPETIDFLKEAMAHVVSLYEDLAYDPEKEDRIFKSLFNRFNILKTTIKEKSKRVPKAVTLDTPTEKEHLVREEPAQRLTQEQAKQDTVTPDVGSGDVENLIHDLQNSLEKAGEVGTAIGQLLADFLQNQQNKIDSPEKNAAGESVGLPPSQPEAASVNILPQQRIKACPATELTLIETGGCLVAIKTTDIALIRSVTPEQLKSYLKSSNVPLKDFAGFMHNLARQFTGTLGQIKNKKLKTLTLPIITPRGRDLAEIPNEGATKLLVISNGSWHGVVACTDIWKDPIIMTKFEEQKNGDIAGLAYLQEDHHEVPLLDSLNILRREGFLLMV